MPQARTTVCPWAIPGDVFGHALTVYRQQASNLGPGVGGALPHITPPHASANVSYWGENNSLLRVKSPVKAAPVRFRQPIRHSNHQEAK